MLQAGHRSTLSAKPALTWMLVPELAGSMPAYDISEAAVEMCQSMFLTQAMSSNIFHLQKGQTRINEFTMISQATSNGSMCTCAIAKGNVVPRITLVITMAKSDTDIANAFMRFPLVRYLQQK
jgi:hypothetical protein